MTTETTGHTSHDVHRRLIATAADVISRAMQQGRLLPASLAVALDSAQLLQSPETAAEHEQVRAKFADAAATVAQLVRERGERMKVENALRDEIAELEAQRERRRVRLVAAEADLMDVRGLLSPNGQTRRIPAEVQIHERVAPAIKWLLNRVAELEARLAEGRTVDEDPIAYALTDQADGITRRIAPLQAMRNEQQSGGDR